MGGENDSEVIAAITSFLDERGLRIVPATAVVSHHDHCAALHRRHSDGADIPTSYAVTEPYSQSASEPDAIITRSFSSTDHHQQQQQQSEFEGLFMMGSSVPIGYLIDDDDVDLLYRRSKYLFASTAVHPWLQDLVDDISSMRSNSQSNVGKPKAAPRSAFQSMPAISCSRRSRLGSLISSVASGHGDDEWSSDDDPGFHRIYMESDPEELASEPLPSPPAQQTPEKQQAKELEVLNLKVYYRKFHTGLEFVEAKLGVGSMVTPRYQIIELLSSASEFSRVFSARCIDTNEAVCLKVVSNSKESFDQSLDEVKLLWHLNEKDVDNDKNLVQLHDFFYWQEHLVLVTELLGASLYEVSGGGRRQSPDRIRRMARQLLVALRHVHDAGIIHTDIKPDNVLFSDANQLDVKLIDFGSSCFVPDRQHRHYVQSLPYRAPEVVLGLAYDTAIDMWSLGCLLCELYSGTVLFSARSQTELLAKMVGIIGPGLDVDMINEGRHSHRFVTRDGALYERSGDGLFILYPKNTSLAARLHCTDESFLSFVSSLLQLRAEDRPSAAEALQHDFLINAFDDKNAP